MSRGARTLPLWAIIRVAPYLRASALICVQKNDLKDLKILVNADKGGFSQMKPGIWSQVAPFNTCTFL
jgi:hypothetical protein